MKKDKHKTRVLFRANKTGQFKGDRTAVMPDLPGTNAWASDCACYAHIGQHGACASGWLRTTRPATPSEYRPLARELRGLGYRLSIVARMPRNAAELRRLAVQP